MPLDVQTDAAVWWQLIISQVGDTSTALLTQQVPQVWGLYADRAQVAGPRLQYLYTKRDAIDLVLGAIREDVDSTIPGDMASKEDQKTTHLRAMRTEVSLEIVRLETRARSSRGGVALPITTVVPALPVSPAQYVPPATGDPDPSYPGYAGSPYPGYGSSADGDDMTP